MTWGLVGMVTVLSMVGCIVLSVGAICLRQVLKGWTTRPDGLDDTLSSMQSLMGRTALDLKDVQARYRKQMSADMRAVQRKSKAERDDDAEEDPTVDVNAGATIDKAVKPVAAPRPLGQDDLSLADLHQRAEQQYGRT